jgi:dolichol-phosphate mannosyltransferase
VLLLLLFAAQAIALTVLVARLAPGARRAPPVAPRPDGVGGTSVTVLVPTLNEGSRLAPCLSGLRRQGEPLREIIVVDSASTDDTRAVVEAAGTFDPRLRLVTDPPIPAGWVGKMWALQHGLSLSHGEWVLGVDADTEAEPGMVAGAVAAALGAGLEVVSFSPRFAGQTAAEQWLQPSMLLTLVYRFGAPAPRTPPDRVMANGQCFLARRDVLERHGGFAAARASFCDDVTLARHHARAGVRVGFLDGSRLYRVRSYASAGEMWREWGRSFDLRDATTPARHWADVVYVLLVQGAPLLVLGALLLAPVPGAARVAGALVWLNAALLTIRVLMTFGIAGAYERRSLAFWLSPLSDPLAALRLVLSSLRRPTAWRGRRYDLSSTGPAGA